MPSCHTAQTKTKKMVKNNELVMMQPDGLNIVHRMDALRFLSGLVTRGAKTLFRTPRPNLYVDGSSVRTIIELGFFIDI